MDIKKITDDNKMFEFIWEPHKTKISFSEVFLGWMIVFGGLLSLAVLLSFILK